MQKQVVSMCHETGNDAFEVQEDCFSSQFEMLAILQNLSQVCKKLKSLKGQLPQHIMML